MAGAETRPTPVPADAVSAAFLLPNAIQTPITKTLQGPQVQTSEHSHLYKSVYHSLRRKVTLRGVTLTCIALAIYTLFMYLPTSSIAIISPCWSAASCRRSAPAAAPTVLATSTNLQQKDLAGEETPTDLNHIVFGIASSASNWETRKEYVKLWWQSPAGETRRRGFVWLDEPPPSATNSSVNNSAFPDVQISENTDRFLYTWENGTPSAIRVSRIVSETFRLGLRDVRWFVMGDDDTVFFPENLAAVLRKYNHKKFYYIGHSSESQKQSALHSFSMAYGGGGFALSFPLAKALERMQDDCLERYPQLYGSDSRIHACIAELGVPLTRELGFHQIDLHGDIFGFLAAHPTKPLISLHHIDGVEPIFPNMTRLQAMKHLVKGAEFDSASTLQQSICYDRHRNFTMSISWGYAVQIFPTIMTPLEVQKPLATFGDWRTWQGDEELFTLDVRRLPMDACQGPSIYFMQNVSASKDGKTLIGVYKLGETPANCQLSIQFDTVEVRKQRQSESWLMASRRQICEVRHRNTSTLGASHPLFVLVRDLKKKEIIAP